MEIARDWFRGPAVNNVCDSRRGAEINREEIGTMSLLRAIGLQVWEGLRRLRSPSICQKKKNIVIAVSSYLICVAFCMCSCVCGVCVCTCLYTCMWKTGQCQVPAPTILHLTSFFCLFCLFALFCFETGFSLCNT